MDMDKIVDMDMDKDILSETHFVVACLVDSLLFVHAMMYRS